MKNSFQILASTLVLTSGFAFAQGNNTAVSSAPTDLKSAEALCKAGAKQEKKACLEKAKADFGAQAASANPKNAPVTSRPVKK